MGNILRRRGMMAVPSSGPSPTPEWDVEWSYTDGLPSDNGFTQTVSGSSTIALATGCVRLTAKGGTDKYAKITYPSNYSKSVMEVQIKTGSNANWYGYIMLSNGTNSIGIRPQYSSGTHNIYLPNASARADMTVVQACALSETYKIKLVNDNGYGDIYINDVLKASNVDMTTIVKQMTNTCVMLYAGSSGTYTMDLYYIKLKLGRTE